MWIFFFVGDIEMGETNKDDLCRLLEQVISSFECREFEKAIEYCDQIRVGWEETNRSDFHHEKEIVADFYKARSLFQLRLYDKAIIFCNDVISMEEEHKEAWNLRGTALYALGKYDEAIESFVKRLR